MKRNILHIILLVSATIMVACSGAIEEKPVQIHCMADAPVALSSARAFSIDDKVYVWGGRDSIGAYHNEIWMYDPALDSWQSAGVSPIKACVRPVVCVVGEDVYMGLGITGTFFIDSCYQRDWWRYRPSTQEWTRLQDYPCNLTMGAVAMTDGQYIYTAFGNYHEENRDVYRYDIARNQWIKLAEKEGQSEKYPRRVQGIAAATCMGRYFMGTGFNWNCYNFWAEMMVDGETVRWEERTAVPGKGRVGATACAADRMIFLCGGRHEGGSVTTGEYYDDILCYHVEENRWTLSGHLPNGPRENMVSWEWHGKIYFGLGNNKYNSPCKNIYCIEP